MMTSTEQRLIHLARSGQDHQQLLEALLLLSKLQNAKMSIDALETRLDLLGVQAQCRLADFPNAADRGLELCRFLAREQGFLGNREDYYDPANSDIASVLKSGRGIPISLAFLYLHCARAMDWRTHGIAFPGHFLVAVYGGQAQQVQGGERENNYVLLDPFDGRLISREECLARLQKQYGDSVQLQEQFFYKAGNTSILRRMLRNLKQCHVRRGDYNSALRMANLLIEVSPADFTERQDRAAILEHLHCYSAAAADLHTISSQRPDHPRMADIKQTIARLEKLSSPTLH